MKFGSIKVINIIRGIIGLIFVVGFAGVIKSTYSMHRIKEMDTICLGAKAESLKKGSEAVASKYKNGVVYKTNNLKVTLSNLKESKDKVSIDVRVDALSDMDDFTVPFLQYSVADFSGTSLTNFAEEKHDKVIKKGESINYTTEADLNKLKVKDGKKSLMLYCGGDVAAYTLN